LHGAQAVRVRLRRDVDREREVRQIAGVELGIAIRELAQLERTERIGEPGGSRRAIEFTYRRLRTRAVDEDVFVARGDAQVIAPATIRHYHDLRDETVFAEDLVQEAAQVVHLVIVDAAHQQSVGAQQPTTEPQPRHHHGEPGRVVAAGALRIGHERVPFGVDLAAAPQLLRMPGGEAVAVDEIVPRVVRRIEVDERHAAFVGATQTLEHREVVPLDEHVLARLRGDARGGIELEVDRRGRAEVREDVRFAGELEAEAIPAHSTIVADRASAATRTRVRQPSMRRGAATASRRKLSVTAAAPSGPCGSITASSVDPTNGCANWRACTSDSARSRWLRSCFVAGGT